MILRTKNSRPHNWLIHHYSAKAITEKSKYMQGTLLDIGCGVKPYEHILKQHCQNYIGIDYPTTRHGYAHIDVFADAFALPFRDQSVDSVVSFQVMEHVTNPLVFLREIYRVTKPGGLVLLTTPFMWGEHEEPHDYYRYTRYGLRYLAEQQGFLVVSIEPDTGYWSTAVLRFNYYIKRLIGKNYWLNFLARLIWLDQYMAFLLDKLDSHYTKDTATFTSLLRKPSDSN